MFNVVTPAPRYLPSDASTHGFDTRYYNHILSTRFLDYTGINFESSKYLRWGSGLLDFLHIYIGAVGITRIHIILLVLLLAKNGFMWFLMQLLIRGDLPSIVTEYLASMIYTIKEDFDGFGLTVVLATNGGHKYQVTLAQGKLSTPFGQKPKDNIFVHVTSMSSGF